MNRHALGLVPQPPHVERTTVAHLTVDAVADATLQLRAAVDLDVHVGPGEHLALPLTRHQAEDLLQDLAAHLGQRVIGIRR
ncbi:MULTISPECIES: hypothetical protein [Kitasatospora]|uniref:hypothetical protein n=1 Tax=Kitasatospora TaxID=2063 RepID=UPI000C714737|nr:hypothetical protein [Kitasatospora sp. GP30]MDH6142149.1 hypothetical protein [Kitasatospora sp. GP30]